MTSFYLLSLSPFVVCFGLGGQEQSETLPYSRSSCSIFEGWLEQVSHFCNFLFFFFNGVKMMDEIMAEALEAEDAKISSGK